MDFPGVWMRVRGSEKAPDLKVKQTAEEASTVTTVGPEAAADVTDNEEKKDFCSDMSGRGSE